MERRVPELTDRTTASLATTIGRFVLATASLELEIDDLLHLANERLQLDSLIRKFPATLEEKLQALQTVASQLNVEWKSQEATNRHERLVSLRNVIVHGRVTHIALGVGGTEIHISRPGRPKKENGRQYLVRESYALFFEELHIGLEEVLKVFEEVERLRSSIWSAMLGWPQYRAPPEGDLFGFSPRSKFMERSRKS